jgi:hypothetical protein
MWPRLKQDADCNLSGQDKVCVSPRNVEKQRTAINEGKVERSMRTEMGSAKINGGLGGGGGEAT